MYIITTPFVVTLIFYPLAIRSQATTTQPNTSQQTIVPFSTWPSCTTSCGTLYDVQGACSPPVTPASNTVSCLCADPRLQPWINGNTGVCDNACTADPDGMNQMRQWYLSLCQKSPNLPSTTGTITSSSSTATAAPSSSGGSSGSGSGNSNGTWMSTHWQWVIMVVVLALAIIIGWSAGCFFRRRYIRRKEREYELRPPAAPWANGGPGAPGPPIPPYADPRGKGKDKEATAGMFVTRPPRPARPDEKPETKKWVVTERT